MPIPRDRSRSAVPALTISGLIWGTAFAFSKFVLGELTVSQLVFLRFGLGSLALLPIIILRRTRLDRKDLPRFILTGFLAVPVTFLLQFNGLALTTTARASLIIGAAPPLLALGGAIFLGERPGLRGWVAVATSMLGILVISGSPGGDGSWSGDGLVFLSIVVSVVWVILNKRLSEKYSALIATAYIMLFGTLTLAPFTLLWDGLPRFDLPLTVWLAVLVLGLICTALAFVLWNWGLERVPASKAGIYLNLEPLVGALLGVIVFRESLGAGVFLGGLLIIGAALIAAQPERKPMGDEVEFDLDKPRDPSINLYHQKSIRLRGCGQINN